MIDDVGTAVVRIRIRSTTLRVWSWTTRQSLPGNGDLLS